MFCVIMSVSLGWPTCTYKQGISSGRVDTMTAQVKHRLLCYVVYEYQCMDKAVQSFHACSH